MQAPLEPLLICTTTICDLEPDLCADQDDIPPDDFGNDVDSSSEALDKRGDARDLPAKIKDKSKLSMRSKPYPKAAQIADDAVAGVQSALTVRYAPRSNNCANPNLGAIVLQADPTTNNPVLAAPLPTAAATGVVVDHSVPVGTPATTLCNAS